MKITVNRFRSVSEYDAWLQTAPIAEFYRNNQHSNDEGDRSFRGTSSWDEAEDLLQHGDKKIAERIEKVLGDSRKKIAATKTRKRITTSVAGFMPNVPAYLQGARKQMFKIEKQVVRDRVITIVFNSAIHCGTTVTEAIETCAKLLQAIMKIESQGMRVNLYNAHLTSSKDAGDRGEKDAGHVVGEVIKIKDSGQYMDVLKMCYPLINPSMHRRHHFRTIEALGSDAHGSWYGFPVRGGAVVNKVITGMHMRGAHVISFYEIHEKSIDEIIEKINVSKM